MPETQSECAIQPAKAQCAFRRKNNTRCRARAQEGTDYCLWHQPDEGRTSASSAVPLLPACIELETAEDVFQLMKTSALHLATVQHLDTGRFHALNAVAGTLLRSLSLKELQADIADLKRQLEDSRWSRREAERERDHVRAWAADLEKVRGSEQAELKKCRNKLLSLGIDPASLEDT